MAQFSRKTVLSATDTLATTGHAEIDRFALEHAIEDRAGGFSRRNRANAIAQYLLSDPDRIGHDGRNLIDAVVEDLVGREIRDWSAGGVFNYDLFQQRCPDLNRALERDGFTLQDGHLQRALPDNLQLPQAQDEVHALLQRFNFHVARGHLDQAINAHARGEWAGANAQLRAFAENLFDEIAGVLDRGAGLVPARGEQRRRWLSEIQPPFLVPELNEWLGPGTGFIQGFYRRLHPQGAHPGLSDEDDSTYRLHLVLLTARLFLRRLRDRVQ
jgi:hypothetical protein